MKNADTTTSLAAASNTAANTIRQYADLGLLKFTTTAAGVRIFEPGQAPLVRKIFQERMARRGGRPKSKRG